MNFIKSLLKSEPSKLFLYTKITGLLLTAVFWIVAGIKPVFVNGNIIAFSFSALLLTTIFWVVVYYGRPINEDIIRNIFLLDSIVLFLLIYPVFYQSSFFFIIPAIYLISAPAFFSDKTYSISIGFLLTLFILSNIVYGLRQIIETPVESFLSNIVLLSIISYIAKIATDAIKSAINKDDAYEKERQNFLSRQEKLSQELSLSRQNSEILNKNIRKRDIEIKNLMVLSGQLNIREDSKVILNSFLLTAIGQIGSSHAAILTRIKKQHNYISLAVQKGLRGIDQSHLRIYLDSSLVQVLNSVREPILISQIPMENLYEDEISILKYFKDDLICPIRIRNIFIGAILVGKKISGNLFDKEDFNLISIVANQAAFVLEQSKLTQNYKEFYAKTIKAMLESLEAKYSYARGHNVRTANYAAIVGRRLNLPINQIKDLTYGSLLHDIGKIVIRDEYLLNSAKFAQDDMQIKEKILEHTLEGSKILKSAGFNNQIIDMALHHHEFYNGKGYPHKIGETDLSLNSRILAVCNAYDAMTSDRPHRKALSHKIAQEYLLHSQNTQFDPEIVKIFLEEIRTNSISQKYN
ncbi:MAG: HD domain-containing protein [Calditrichaceae bacterium]|nr:HD domain-containing protein [Calditrichaceae bacterium]